MNTRFLQKKRNQDMILSDIRVLRDKHQNHREISIDKGYKCSPEFLNVINPKKKSGIVSLSARDKKVKENIS